MPGGLNFADDEAIRHTSERRVLSFLRCMVSCNRKDQDAAVARYERRKVVVATMSRRRASRLMRAAGD